MEKVPEFRCLEILQKVVERFGDGNLPNKGYVFDEIKKLPSGYIGKKIDTEELISSDLRNASLLSIVFDPHPQSRFVSDSLLRNMGMAPALGLWITKKELPMFLAAQDCDFYLCDSDDNLIAVGTHEDEVSQQKRYIWCLRKN